MDREETVLDSRSWRSREEAFDSACNFPVYFQSSFTSGGPPLLSLPAQNVSICNFARLTRLVVFRILRFFRSRARISPLSFFLFLFFFENVEMRLHSNSNRSKREWEMLEAHYELVILYRSLIRLQDFINISPIS